MTESMILRVEAAIAEAVIETGDREFISKLGLFLADHPGLIGRAAIEAMREPTQDMAKVGTDARWQSAVRDANNAREIWRAMIDAALIWPAASADRAGVPLARD